MLSRGVVDRVEPDLVERAPVAARTFVPLKLHDLVPNFVIRKTARPVYAGFCPAPSANGVAPPATKELVQFSCKGFGRTSSFHSCRLMLPLDNFAPTKTVALGGRTHVCAARRAPAPQKEAGGGVTAF